MYFSDSHYSHFCHVHLLTGFDALISRFFSGMEFAQMCPTCQGGKQVKNLAFSASSSGDLQAIFV
jgi:hypothetical protein